MGPAGKTTHPLPLEGLDLGPYRPGEEGAILDCMEACFGYRREPESWRHVYLNNPAGQTIVMLARDRGIVVGHSAILTRRIHAFGRQGLAGHSIYAMTRPEWQRKGLNRILANEARRLGRERGFLVTYGFTNEQSTPVFIKYQDGQPVRPFPVMMRPLRPVRAGLALGKDRVLRALSRPPRATNEAHPSVDDSGTGTRPSAFEGREGGLRQAMGWASPSFDVRHTTLFQMAEALPPIAVVRDATHLAWRYPPAPGSPYLQRDTHDGLGLAATAVVRVAAQFGMRLVFVMEWLWRRDARRDGAALIRDVVRLARAAGAHGAAALAMPGTLQRRLLWRLGFIPIPELLFPGTITLMVRLERELPEGRRWFQPSSWYLTWGDGDLL